MNIDGKSNATNQESEPVDAVRQAIDQSLPEGSVRTATPLLRDESGEVVLSVISWKIPGAIEQAETDTHYA